MIIKLNDRMSVPEQHVYGIMAQLTSLWSLATTLSDPSVMDRWSRQFQHDTERYGGWMSGNTIEEVIRIMKKEAKHINLSVSGIAYRLELVDEECSSKQLVYREGIVGPPLELARHISFVQLSKEIFSRVVESGVTLPQLVEQPAS